MAKMLPAGANGDPLMKLLQLLSAGGAGGGGFGGGGGVPPFVNSAGAAVGGPNINPNPTPGMVTETGLRAGPRSPGGPSSPGGLGGEKTAIGSMGKTDKLQAWMKNPALKGVGTGLFAYFILSQLMKTYGDFQMGNIQTKGMEQMGEAMTPESAYYQAMMPAAQQELESSRMMLLQQLMGSGGGQLAAGEEMFG